MIKTLLIIVMSIAMMLLFWVSVPLVWYPKFAKIDTASLTEEVDTLFSYCGADSSTGALTVPLTAEDTPYVVSLESQDVTNNELIVNCVSGVRLKLWDDWWAASAGLYIVRDGYKLPTNLEGLVTPLSERVYSWHDTNGRP